MSTYSDMMALLITFFVLLLSMSTLEQKKFASAMASLKGALGVLSATGTTIAITNMPTYSPGKGQTDQMIQAQIQNIQAELARTNLADLMNIQLTKDVLRFSISEGLAFDSGRAEVKREAMPFLVAIADILNLVPFEIRVEGHTDNIPIRTAQFPSNWELSYSRALAISQSFMNSGVNSARFQIVGFGDQRPKADNDTPQGRALNRRVEIEINMKNEIRRSLIPGE
jgi:chemotaxis protein MotB